MIRKLPALIFVFFLLFLFIHSFFAQSDCKVLNPSLCGVYIGKCKNGFANGWGMAEGIDRYTGQFRNGLPHGKGTYIWKTGETYTGKWERGFRNGQGKFTFKFKERDSLLNGIWENDKFIGPEPEPPAIILKQNIARVTFQRIGEGAEINISFAAVYQRDINDLMIIVNNGIEYSSGMEVYYDYVEFPFNCKISYRTSDSRLAVRHCNLEFMIRQPGSWIVTIMN